MHRTQWISHRGYKKNAVENTREAFAASRDVGFSWAETDLRISKDGHIVLHHDPSLERLTGRSDKIFNLTRAELEAVELENGARLMFLDQLFEEFADLNWIFDIKVEHGSETLTALIRLAEKMGKSSFLQKQRFLFWSARQENMLAQHMPSALRYARKEECAKAGVCLLTKLPLSLVLQEEKIYSVPHSWLGIKFLRRDYVDRLRAAGVRTLSFLPRGEAQLQDALESGCDEILTDYLPKYVK